MVDKRKPNYRLRQSGDNWLFLDYGGGDWELYDFRMAWTNKRHHSQAKGQWFLCILAEHHENALEILPYELELATRALKELKEQANG